MTHGGPFSHALPECHVVVVFFPSLPPDLMLLFFFPCIFRLYRYGKFANRVVGCFRKFEARSLDK